MNDPIKILIVDDESSIVETLKDILVFEGYKVGTADNALTAIEKVKNNGISLVLMDFKMPDMNGVEAFREIIKINPELKVIFITAFYHEEKVMEALSEGATDIFHKPLDVPQLLNCIKAAV